MNTVKQSEPSEIELLLPWYAAGTLDARESEQVEAALANDPELAARYEWVRAELEQETHVRAAALASVLQAGFLAGIVLKESSAGGYETASAPANVPGEGSYVLLRFQPQ